jgi:hypothetical protein
MLPENRKYSEKIIRHAAVTADGKPCEILERLTYEQEVFPDGSLGEPVQINQRFDLRTGQRVNHIEGDRFEIDVSGDPLTRVRA